jgi:anti-sigma regulatory factor (Ser/Thr protein kinase)
MTSSHAGTEQADVCFVRRGAADARAVARLREEFTEWLCESFRLDDVRASDIVLVVNEALSNAAEFAYRNRDTPESILLQATYQGSTGALVVTVSDRGEWRASEPATRKLSRGRGIPLMRALADRVDIDKTAKGTQVHLYFDRCPTRSADRDRQLSA